MTNNLKKIEKDLRSLAKRCKDIRYTKGLLLSFLMMGLLSFSEGLTSPGVKNAENSINQARKELNTSISDMKALFREAKKENNKLADVYFKAFRKGLHVRMYLEYKQEYTQTINKFLESEIV